MTTGFLKPLFGLLVSVSASRFTGVALADTPPPVAATQAVGAIPDRPEKLTFPPLKYEPPDPADHRVQLKSGPVAYVIPDRELPLVNIVVYIRTGEYLEPVGKEGLASLTGYLLARGGTKSKTAEQLEERLAFLAAQLNSDIGSVPVSGGGPVNLGSVSLNLLSKDLDEGLGILREVLTAPRFQDDKIALRKQQMLQEMQQRNDDSADIEAREKGFLAFGEKFWVNHYSTAESVKSVRRGDLESFHRRWFAPQNFVVAVSGDFDRDAMIARLERLFDKWPFPGETPPPVPTNAVFAPPGVYLVNKPDVNQGRVSLMLPGIRRDSPDYFVVLVMNDILGGGGFMSRLLNRVRSDEGLAYSAGSRFPGGVYFPLTFTALFQTKSRTVAYAASIVLDEVKKIAAVPVSDAELTTSKSAFIERFPHNFATKTQVAMIFAQDEFTGRHATEPDYWKKFRDRISILGKDHIQRVAKKYLAPDKFVILVVGNKDDILFGHPDHPIKLTDLGGGRLTELPLRDPLTLKPMASAAK
jgi:zinc protease